MGMTTCPRDSIPELFRLFPSDTGIIWPHALQKEIEKSQGPFEAISLASFSFLSNSGPDIEELPVLAGPHSGISWHVRSGRTWKEGGEKGGQMICSHHIMPSETQTSSLAPSQCSEHLFPNNHDWGQFEGRTMSQNRPWHLDFIIFLALVTSLRATEYPRGLPMPPLMLPRSRVFV